MGILKRIWRDITATRVDLVHLLIGINLLGFVITLLMTDRLERELGLSSDDAGSAALRICGANDLHLVMSGQLHRWLTACFLHNGPLHLAFNCWFLYQIGRVARDALGSRRFFILFVIGGLGGSMASTLRGAWPMLLDTELALIGGRSSVGASGALFSLIGFLLAYLRRSDEVLSVLWKQQLIFCLILNVVLGIALPGIDNAAHAGGFIAGWLLEGVMRREGQWHGGLSNSRATAGLLAFVLIASFAAAVYDQQRGFGRDFGRAVRREALESRVLRIIDDLESSSYRPYCLEVRLGLEKAASDLEDARARLEAFEFTETERSVALRLLLDVYRTAVTQPEHAPRGARLAAQRRFQAARIGRGPPTGS